MRKILGEFNQRRGHVRPLDLVEVGAAHCGGQQDAGGQRPTVTFGLRMGAASSSCTSSRARKPLRARGPFAQSKIVVLIFISKGDS